MQPKSSPLRRLPEPATLHAHLGRLVREIRLTRQLLRLAQAARDHNGRAIAAGQPTPGR
jgi:hypothetical protein